MTLQASSAVDTHSDAPAFVPESELRAALAAAQAAARERDELVAEVGRLRIGADVGNGRGGSDRRSHLLREALTLKDREILYLKDHGIARERQFLAAREALGTLQTERNQLAQRVRSAEAALAEVEGRRAASQPALENVQREVHRLADSLAQTQAELSLCVEENDALRAAHSRTVGDLRGLEQVRAELEASLQGSAADLEASLRASATEAEARDRAHARVIEVLRDELDAWTESLRDAHALAMNSQEHEYAVEIGSLRAEHALKLEALDRDHARTVQELREERTREVQRREDAEVRIALLCEEHEKALGSLRESRAFADTEVAVLRDERDQARSEVAVLRDERDDARCRVASLEGTVTSLEGEIAGLRERHATEIAALESAHESARIREVEAVEARYGAEADAAFESFNAEQQATREAHEGVVADLERARCAEVERLQALVDEAVLGARRELEARDAVEAERERLAGTLRSIEDRARDQEAELGKVQATLEEVRTSRDEAVLKLVHAIDEVERVTQAGDEAAEVFGTELREVEALVGRLTGMLVVQEARLSATRAGRSRPGDDDLDEALSRVADQVPDRVASELWAAREVLLDRWEHDAA